MKVYLIKAAEKNQYSKFNARTGGPPQNIFSAAASTPKNVNIQMTDESIKMEVNFNSNADIIAIFTPTSDAQRAYEIATTFKKKNKTVVLAGLHTKFNQEEALTFADSILIGETEGIWEQLLSDFNNKQLHKKYERTEPCDLSKINPYPTNIIPPKMYNNIWSVVVTRGCKNKCNFCLVHKFFSQYTLRPINQIVKEIRQLKKIGVKWIELHSDNLTLEREYALKLFKALESLKMNFFGETTILIAKDEELLLAAKKAGLKGLLFGIETPAMDALKANGKGFINPYEVEDYVSKIRKYGIVVWVNILFGFDQHHNSIFSDSFIFSNEINADRIFPHLLIPYPGTSFFNKLEDEKRIITKDWSKYDGANAVYNPLNISANELEKGLNLFWTKTNGYVRSFLYSLFPSI